METGHISEIIKRTRLKTGMTQKEFAEYFGIPRRTYQDWELGNRTMPEYLLKLVLYKLETEGLI